MRGILRYIIIFISGFFFCSPAAYGQNLAECKNLVLKYVNDISKITEPVGERSYYLKYTFETINKPGGPNKDMAIAAEMALSRDKSFFESNVIRMYADTNDGFMILPIQRQVIWGPGGKTSNTSESFSTIAAFQDSLVRFSTVTSCVEIKNDSSEMKEIILNTPERVKKVFKVDRILLNYDLKKKQIVKVIQFFTKNSDISRITVNYLEMNFDYQGKLLKSSAYDKVLTSNRRLKPYLKGYELIDNRNKNQ